MRSTKKSTFIYGDAEPGGAWGIVPVFSKKNVEKGCEYKNTSLLLALFMVVAMYLRYHILDHKSSNM